MSAAVVAVLGACAGTGGTPEAPPWPETLDVPRIETVGRLPAVEERAVIVVRRDGSLAIDGTDITLDALPAELGARGRNRGWTGPPAGNPVDVVIACDAQVPWRRVQWVLQAGAQPQASVARVFFGVRHARTNDTGAIALFLPHDRGLAADMTTFRERPTYVVKIDAKGDAVAPGALYPPLREAVAKSSDLDVHLDAAPGTPAGLIMEVADVCSLAGVANLLLVGTPPPHSTMAALEGREMPLARRIRLSGRELPAPTAIPPRRDPMPDALAGFLAPIVVPPPPTEALEDR